MGSLPLEYYTKFQPQCFFSARPGQSSDAMVATIDGPKSLPREATLSKPLVAPTTELDTSRRRDSNASVLMHRLPTEIFIYLITLVLADPCFDGSPWIVYTCTAQLKLVCLLWAYKINSYPRFWNVLTNRLGPGHLSAVIRRSRAVPLHVDLSFVPNQDIETQTYITVIKSIAHRWSTLNISRFGSDNKEACKAVLHDLLQVPAPQLQKLSFVGYTPTLPTTIRLFGGRAPLLHTATITPDDWSIIRPIIPRLKRLAVEGPWLSQGQPGQLRLGMVIQALISSPEIEEIKLSGLGRQFAESVESLTIPSSPILLARVRSVTLDQIAGAWALGLLAAIRFPGDCAVNIDMQVSPDPGQLEPVLSMLYARFTQVVPLGVDIQITPSIVLIVLSYERGGAGGMRITFRCMRVRHIKDFIDHVPRQLTEAIQASGISVHLRVGRQVVDGTREFPSEVYRSIMETVDGHLPSTTRASIYGLYFTEFITYAKSGFSNLSELIIEERRIVAPWEQLVELAESRSSRAADPASRIAALENISLPSKGLDEGARERLSRVVAELNWTDDPHAYWSPGLPTKFRSEPFYRRGFRCAGVKRFIPPAPLNTPSE